MDAISTRVASTRCGSWSCCVLRAACCLCGAAGALRARTLRGWLPGVGDPEAPPDRARLHDLRVSPTTHHPPLSTPARLAPLPRAKLAKLVADVEAARESLAQGK